MYHYYVIFLILLIILSLMYKSSNLEGLTNNYSTRFVNKGPILNTKTTKLYDVNYDTNMAISFKLKLDGKSDGWTQILGITTSSSGGDNGNNGGIRGPGLWVHPNSEKLHFMIHTDNNWNTAISNNKISSEIGKENRFDIIRNNNRYYVYKNKSLVENVALNRSSSTMQNKGYLYTSFSGYNRINGIVSDVVVIFSKTNLSLSSIDNSMKGSSKSVLMKGESLKPGEFLVSNSGEYLLNFNIDGTLNIGKVKLVNNNAKLDTYTDDKSLKQNKIRSDVKWNSGVSSDKYAVKLTFEENGNVTLKDRNNKILWATNSISKDSKYLVIKNNGKLAVLDSNGNNIWSS